MLRVHCTTEDLLKVTVADRPAPLQEQALAFAMLQRRDADPVFSRWRRRVAHSLPRSTHPLLELVSPLGAGPYFLDPPSHDIEEGLDHILRTPRAQTREDLKRMCALDRPLTPWLRHLADHDREAWQILAHAVRTTHTQLIDTSPLQAGFHSETAWCARALTRQGVRSALAGLTPSARWRGMTLEADFPRDLDLTLHGRGIVLRPSLFWSDHLLASLQPDGRLVLIYPAITPMPLREETAPGDPLAALLGTTRAHALRLLVHQHTTTGLARELTLTPAAASLQTRTLREAGLITSQRDGKAIWHHCTPLGLDLLTHASTHD